MAWWLPRNVAVISFSSWLSAMWVTQNSECFKMKSSTDSNHLKVVSDQLKTNLSRKANNDRSQVDLWLNQGVSLKQDHVNHSWRRDDPNQLIMTGKAPEAQGEFQARKCSHNLLIYWVSRAPSPLMMIGLAVKSKNRLQLLNPKNNHPSHRLKRF